MLDQTDALLLAACNSVGVGAYDNQVSFLGLGVG